MQRIKVTFCAYDKPDSVGGPVTWIQRLAPMLTARGIDVRCLFILHRGDTGPALSSLRAEGIPCEAVAGLDRTEDRVRWIIDKLNLNPPDVFVPNLVVAAYFAARYARGAGISTVGILHSDDTFYRGIADQFVSGAAQYRVSSVVCVSSELERQMIERGPGGVRVARIPYGVDVPADRVHRIPGVLRLSYVGRLAEEQKRISEVVRAFCGAAAQIDGVEARIYGDGPDRSVVERILNEEGHGLPVHLAGRIDADRVQTELLRSDVIALLSDYEGLPIALLEAMACGCVPVCLRMRSGIGELVEDGVTGLLVDDRTESFLGAVTRLRDDPALWTRLSETAREHIARSFSSDSSADGWAALLRELGGDGVERRKIHAPRKLGLPHVHPDLASADVRDPHMPVSSKMYRTTRTFLGRLRRHFGDLTIRKARRPGEGD